MKLSIHSRRNLTPKTSDTADAWAHRFGRPPASPGAEPFECQLTSSRMRWNAAPVGLATVATLTPSRLHAV